MVLRNFVYCFIFTTLLFACNRIENNAKQLGDKAKSKSKQLIDTAINQFSVEGQTDSFAITSIVKEFENDKSITEIKGIQTDNNFFYTEYGVYTGQKKKVLKAINNITPQKANDIHSDKECYPITNKEFYDQIAPNERNKKTTFFWNFERLKSFEIYTCVKAPLHHYIIFDKNSDTVYHRIEEIKD